MLEHATPAQEQRAAGAERRREVPAARTPAGRRPPTGRDPVAIVEAEDAGRVAELVPIRHARMAASPFAFLRGSAAVGAAARLAQPFGR
jgi:hypothetical protein